MQNIDSMSVQYFNSPAATVPIAASSATSASTIKVTIVGKKTTAGRNIVTTQTLLTTKLNDTPTNVGPLPLAINQQPSSRSVLASAKNTTFTSAANYSSASRQWQRSTNNGATWTNISGATGLTYTLATVSLGLDGYQYRMVASSAGETAISQPATLNVSLWEDLTMYENWSAYNAGYTSPGYTITPTGEVFLKGMISGGNDAYNTTIAILPPEARPTSRLIFHVGAWASGSGVGRVDVLPTGEIRVLGGASTVWTSLDSIHFMPADACSFTDLTLANGWTNYGGGYPALSVCKDSVTKVHVQGLIKPGTTGSGTAIAGLPSGFVPAQSSIVPASRSGNTGVFGSFGVYMSSSSIVARGATSGTPYISTNTSYFPSSYTTWSTPALQSGWVFFGPNYTSPQYTKSSDGVVTVKGFLKSGTATNGTVIFNLPAGYRPAKRLLMNGVSNDSHVRIDVNTNGNITVEGGASSSWLSLDDIVFVAEQ